MKKNKTVWIVMCVLLSGIVLGFSTRKTNSSTILNDNVEALVQNEQPNIDDCVPDPELTCIALHPTDPDKDQKKTFSRWP